VEKSCSVVPAVTGGNFDVVVVVIQALIVTQPCGQPVVPVAHPPPPSTHTSPPPLHRTLTTHHTMSKTVVITGGTGGIGYQCALQLATDGHTVIITGRSESTGNVAVKKLKEASMNEKVHLAIGDLSLQAGVKTCAESILSRFSVIDELINNAGNLTVGAVPEYTSEGVEKNVAVNVIAPLLLSRLLVPALSGASPKGKIQIVSGGLPIDTVNVADIEGLKKGVGIASYSHSKRVMESMAISLAAELKDAGICVNVVGGGLPGATAMTADVGCMDLPCFVRCCYPCFKMVMHKDDKGKSAKSCAQPVSEYQPFATALNPAPLTPPFYSLSLSLYAHFSRTEHLGDERHCRRVGFWGH
jgi:NAD(P)-dependent dehydrogenase (short-subunit alcohol dehydrogenase family)